MNICLVTYSFVVVLGNPIFMWTHCYTPILDPMFLSKLNGFPLIMRSAWIPSPLQFTHLTTFLCYVLLNSPIVSLWQSFLKNLVFYFLRVYNYIISPSFSSLWALPHSTRPCHLVLFQTHGLWQSYLKHHDSARFSSLRRAATIWL